MPRVAPCRSSTVPHRPAPRCAHVPGQLAVFTLGSTPHVQTSSDAIPPPRSATEDTGLAIPPLCLVMCAGLAVAGTKKAGGWWLVAVAAVTQSLSPSHLQSPLQLRAAAQSRAAAKL